MPHSSVKSAKTVQESEPHASDCFICNSHVHYDDKENTWVMKQEDKNCIEHPKRLPPKFHLKDVARKHEYNPLYKFLVLWRMHRRPGRILGLQFWNTVEQNNKTALQQWHRYWRWQTNRFEDKTKKLLIFLKKRNETTFTGSKRFQATSASRIIATGPSTSLPTILAQLKQLVSLHCFFCLIFLHKFIDFSKFFSNI